MDFRISWDGMPDGMLDVHDCPFGCLDHLISREWNMDVLISRVQISCAGLIEGPKFRAVVRRVDELMDQVSESGQTLCRGGTSGCLRCGAARFEIL